MAKVQTNETRLDQLDLTLTASELYRLIRGDCVEIAEAITQGVNMLTVKNESPSSVQDLEAMRFEIRRLRRDGAYHQSTVRQLVYGKKNIPGVRRCGAICPTIGDSIARLFRLLTEITRITDVEFPLPIIIADDGCGFSEDKRHVTAAFSCAYVENRHEPGISGNLNSAIERLESRVEFIILLDDGAIPHRHWLPALSMMLDSIPQDVVMVGCAHLQDWQLALGGLLGDRWPLRDWCNRPYGLGDMLCSHFYDTFGAGHSVTFGDVLTGMPTDADWPNDEVRDLVHYNRIGHVAGDLHPLERQCRECKYLLHDRWPNSKQPLRECWSPGAQGLILRRDFLDEIGGFGSNCAAYEQLIAVKAAERGKRVMYADCPPFIHFPSLGFVELQEQKVEREPMRAIGEVCQELWGEPDPFKVIERFVK